MTDIDSDDFFSVKNVSYTYGDQQVLFDINFEMTLNDFLSIAGPNGSGKTTLIKLVTDLLELQSGSIRFDGYDNKDIQTKVNLIYLPSDDYLPEFLTGYEYLLMLGELYDKEIDQEKVQILASYYAMENRVHQLIENYSHGMKKKIQLISAFLIAPKLIIIDETLNGIDIEAKEVSKLLLKNHQKNGGATILCTHDLELVEEIESRVLLLNEGVIKYDSKEYLEKNERLVTIFKNLIDYEQLYDEINQSY
ncbi:ATP-binding cassette domain-containing protein [Candidatus Enterococcus ikei]|uniref:ABC transporter ATP-binding protein n=1 Tax=Candidatus Enterococcus ikei TaxID=2815326 RepID=A0ABS3H2W9_9ENTE|nr:ABC transporter ATP-binding protein [Enterococcus sp. DIV0869a]